MTSPQILLPNLVDLLAEATPAAERVFAAARVSIADTVIEEGRVSSAIMEREQHAAHGLSWLATYVEALRQIASYASRMDSESRFGEMEALLCQVGAGEYLAQVFSGIPMSQTEFIRPQDFDVSAADLNTCMNDAASTLIANGNTREARTRLAALITASDGADMYGDAGLDETLEAFRGEMRRFANAQVTPHAHEWHLANDYIPLEVIAQLSELGVFGLTIPEEYGGLGMGKESMCVVSEELSRGYIGVGSLGTRSEIAAELILGGGSDDQKVKWLPKIAAGEILPTAVFTEPNTGSDLASLKTRAARDGDVYRITGNKTWITHPVRADLMTLLVRTGDADSGYRGLSMFLAEKPRGTDDDPFPGKRHDRR